MRRLMTGVLAAAAFLLGTRLAGGEPPASDVSKELLRRQKYLFKDLRKIEQAVKGVKEIRDMRATGEFVLNATERKLEKTSRKDFHIFMERFRNDTLEVLAIYDRVLNKEDYVDPLKRAFGRALTEVVQVQWEEVPMEDVIAEISEGYGVQLNVSGKLNFRKTMTLKGQMSLLSILLYIENVWDAKIIQKGKDLWFEAIPSTDGG